MSAIPKRNLPPDAEQWGRSVDARIERIEKVAERAQQDTDNAQSSINSTVNKLSEQVKAIDTLTQTLAAQQATLASQQSQLTAQVAQIQSVVNSQVYPASGHSDRYVYNLYPGANAEILAVNIAVPAGYSRALVFGTVSLSVGNTSGGLEAVYAGVSIEGTSLGYSSVTMVENTHLTQVTQSGSLLVSSLGSVINISGRGSTANNPLIDTTSHNTANLDVMAVFLR